LSLFTPVLRADSTKARVGRNWTTFNSPSWLAEGWRERPCPRLQLRFLASPGAVTGAAQVVHSGQPPFPQLFSPSAGAVQAAWGSERDIDTERV